MDGGRRPTDYPSTTDSLGGQGEFTNSTTVPLPRPNSRSSSKPRGLGKEALGHPMLRKPPPMTMVPKSHNAQKYCEFRKQNYHTTAECRELKKVLYEITNKGLIDRFLKKAPPSIRKGCNSARKEPREGKCSTKIWIYRGHYPGYMEGPDARDLAGPDSGVREPLRCLTTFGGRTKGGRRPRTQILFHIRSSIDIITWDCLRRLKHPGREIVPLVHPILGFGGQKEDQRIAREYYLFSILPLVKAF
ncbi:hypothetical protein Cgig2_002370 [Carnegiea gigantea]|uniref:Uncharacterized protein n=1 Tax=Carnegiea gigantea TaxID=171969 RepID=A0A9Q1K5N1_9CARY|nr:hypothetical protein Cgig2_002370 [Carnegiea gigantea]